MRANAMLRHAFVIVYVYACAAILVKQTNKTSRPCSFCGSFGPSLEFVKGGCRVGKGFDPGLEGIAGMGRDLESQSS